MNIFVLDEDPVVAAKSLCDRHITKMCLETAQLLCSAFGSDINTPYRKTHVNHPCSVWTRKSLGNFMWLCEHGSAISSEYSARYGKVHASLKIIEWCKSKSDAISFPSHSLTPFALAMPEKYKSCDAVGSYRQYYVNEKRGFATWKSPSAPPAWWLAACDSRGVLNG